jgi:ribosomal-protein-alanine N-acetyltransferase
VVAATLLTEHETETASAAVGLETARLRLRMFRREDLGALSAITSDPEAMRYIGHGRTLSRQETSVNLDSIIAGFRRRGFGRWALEKKGTGEVVGYCGLSLGSEEVGVELAYLLARSEWGRGLASEAGRACLRYAFETLGLGSVAGLTLHDNLRSRRVLEGLGMSYVGPAHFYGFDCVRYSVPRRDWRDDGSPYRVVS